MSFVYVIFPIILLSWVQLKRLRALILADAAQYSEFFTHLRDIEQAVQSCISDLRSLVVREACITVA